MGGASIDAHGKPLTDEVLAMAKASDAVVLGAMGGPKWDGLDYSIRPERALLALRQELGLFANLRPVKLFAPLARASTLKPEVVEGTDLVVVRELTGGIYFGQPKGVTVEADGSERGVNTLVYTTPGDRTDRPGGLRRRPPEARPGDLRRQGQRAGVHRAVAQGGDPGPRRRGLRRR